MIVLPLIFVGLGGATAIGALLLWLRERVQFAGASRWVRADATIVEARYEVSTDPEGDEWFRPQVRYVFRADGRERRGERVRLSLRGEWRDRGEAEAWLARHPAGGIVPVWYDPADPDRATLALNPPATGAFATAGVAGLTFVAIGVATWAAMRL